MNVAVHFVWSGVCSYIQINLQLDTDYPPDAAPTKRVPIIGKEAIDQVEASAVLNDMLKKHPERLIRLKAAILKANQDPTVQGELSDARKRIRTYVIQNDPADIDLLEALTRARTIQEHNNRESQAIY